MKYNDRHPLAGSTPEMDRVFRWHDLINELDEAAASLRIGFAATWGLVHAGDYEAARASFDDSLAHWTEIKEEAKIRRDLVKARRKSEVRARLELEESQAFADALAKVDWS